MPPSRDPDPGLRDGEVDKERRGSQGLDGQNIEKAGGEEGENRTGAEENADGVGTTDEEKEKTVRKHERQEQEMTGKADVNGGKVRSDWEKDEIEYQRERSQETTSGEENDKNDEIQLKEVWTALLEALRVHPKGTFLVEWKSTIQTLFSLEHARLPIKKHLVAQQKLRYPELTDAEVTHLLELIAVTQEKKKFLYEDWKRKVAVIGKKLYTESRMLSDILIQMTSQARWTPAPVLDKWAQVVQGGEQQQEKDVKAEFKPFMFNPDTYEVEDIRRLEKLCLRSLEQCGPEHQRKGTQDEWDIVKGMMEGNIACRELPQFVKQILNEDERLRLYGTILAQVEGELVLRLRGREKLHETQQSTKAIVEAILRAAEPGATKSLHNFINALKTVSYNRVEKQLHFYFFTRETATMMAQVPIPFRGTVYGLRNVHSKGTGNPWENQRRTNSRQVPANVYEVRVHNVTRFVEVGLLKAYLRQQVKMEFTMETMDKCNPKSNLSTVWRLQFNLSGCPTFLDKIVRINWFGQNLILQHPRTQIRHICLSCGGQGHRMAQCSEEEEKKTKDQCRIVTEADLTGLEDLAKPFASMDDVRMTVEVRLKRQDSKTTANGAVNQTYPEEEWKLVGHALKTDKQTAGERIEIPPKPGKKTIPIRLRAKTARFKVFKQDFYKTRAGTSTDSGAEEESMEDDKKDGSGDANTATGDKKQETITGPALLIAELKRERDTWENLQEKTHPEPSTRLNFRHFTDKGPEPEEWQDIEQILGIREVKNTGKGNCQAVAIAQAVADDDLQGQPKQLEQMVATLKRGNRVIALTNLEKQFPHAARRDMLLQVGRGWPSMSSKNSLKVFQQYLNEYATSPSNENATVPKKNWGGSDMLSAAANFLQRDIYVIGRETMSLNDWQCTQFTYGMKTKEKETYVTGLQYILTIRDCMNLIAREKQKAIETSGQTPLVLRFERDHYTAYIHRGVALRPPEHGLDQDVVMEEVSGVIEEKKADSHSNEAEVQNNGAEWGSSEERLYSDADEIKRSLTEEFEAFGDTDSQEEYIPPGELMDEGQKQLVPYQPIEKTSVKRVHSSTPNAKIRVKGATINHNNAAVPFKRGKLEAGEATTREEVEAANVRPAWMDQWDKFQGVWPDKYVDFPAANAEQDKWLQVAQSASGEMLDMLRQFPHREEIMNRLDSTTIAVWMESKRRECIVDGLTKLMDKSRKASTKAWLEDWRKRWHFAKTQKQATKIVDNESDWGKLRNLKYGDDELLQLCDPGRKKQGARHIVCAELYAEEIGALNGIRASQDAGTPTKVRNHLHALKEQEEYSSAFSKFNNEGHWSSISRYFATAVALLDSAEYDNADY